MVMLWAAVPVLIPATISALYFAARAYSRRRRYGGHLVPLALHGAALALTGVMIGLVASSGKPRPAPLVPQRQATPPSARDQDLAGYAWAADNLISRESDCTSGTEGFIAGCQRYARQHTGGPPSQ